MKVKMNSKKLYFVNILLLLSFAFSQGESFARRIPKDIQKQIDDFVREAFLPESEIQGLSLGIIQNDGELLYTTGYGMADIARQLPNGNDTQFGIGSISKGFTGLIVAKTLHEHFPDLGESVLDTPVADLAPQLNLTFGDRYRTEHVTVRDLLSHKTCTGMNLVATAAGAIPTVDEVLYRQRYEPEICGFRTGAVYTNQLVAVASEVAAAIAQKPFEILIQELFDLLGMNHSSLLKVTDDFHNMNGSRALPYYIANGQAHPYNPQMLSRVIPIIASGGVFSTPNDMMRYLNFLLNKGKLDGEQIVREEIIQWIFEYSHKGSNTLQNKEDDLEKVVSTPGYGLGWYLGSYDGWKHNSHGGSLPPYLGLVSLFPSQNLAIFTSAHESPDKYAKTALHIFIFELLKGNPNAKEIALNYMKRGSNQQIDGGSDFLQFGNPSSLENQATLNVIRNLKQTASYDIMPPVGLYGNGANGDLYLSERFNDELNETSFYVQYGKFYSGYLEGDARYPGILYKLNIDTDAMHDFHAYGLDHLVVYVIIILPQNEDTEKQKLSLFVSTENLDFVLYSIVFTFGESLETLPRIPWTPGSC